MQEGGSIDYTFDTPQYTGSALITVTGYGDRDANGYETQATQTLTVLSPRQKLFNDMFALAYKNYRDPYYYHAPAQEDWDRGVCKNFVMRMFDTFKDAYAMAETAASGDASATRAVPFSPAQLEIRASVSVTFDMTQA